MDQQEKERILIVDDENMNLRVLADLLKDEYLPILARTGEQALKHAFSDTPPDLILLDVVMPEIGGYEIIKNLKNSDNTKNIPVIFVTSLNSTEDEEYGLKLGAVDYITKPFSPPIVKMRVRNHLRIVRQYKLLDQLAYLDGLTEISNRRRFEEVYEREWTRAIRSQSPLSLAMVDVDYFKQYNDNYGHAMGDIALQMIAKNLKRSLMRPADLVARYGGEEFVMMLPETDLHAAKLVAKRSLEVVTELAILHEYSTTSPYISVSIGLASVLMNNSIQRETLIKVADQNLYLAKHNGRNQIIASTVTSRL